MPPLEGIAELTVDQFKQQYWTDLDHFKQSSINILGRGGFGIVFNMKNLGEESANVAFKIIRCNISVDNPSTPPLIQRTKAADVEKELRKFDHPNVSTNRNYCKMHTSADREIIGLILDEILKNMWWVPKTVTDVLKDATLRGSGFYVIASEQYDLSLSQYLHEKGALGEDVGKEVMKQIITAVAYCHENGIAHLDLKPPNIMIKYKLVERTAAKNLNVSYGSTTVEIKKGEKYYEKNGKPVIGRDGTFNPPHDSTGKSLEVAKAADSFPFECKLIDFGISSTAGRSCDNIGTEQYMAPEQFKIDYKVNRLTGMPDIDALKTSDSFDLQKVDVWCIGVICYEVLFGNVPDFKSESVKLGHLTFKWALRPGQGWAASSAKNAFHRLVIGNRGTVNNLKGMLNSQFHSTSALEFIHSILRSDPAVRPTAAALLQSKWIATPITTRPNMSAANLNRAVKIFKAVLIVIGATVYMNNKNNKKRRKYLRTSKNNHTPGGGCRSKSVATSRTRRHQ